MCGIVGYVGDNHASTVARMNDSIIHRGPDDFGVYSSDTQPMSVGMRRLAILDLKAGKQPMVSEDGNVVIVYNGEVFNAPELRQELESEGVVFSTNNSDTEVILRLYQTRGERVVEYLNGMFAFCIYDKSKAQLFGARDPLGIKPFYLWQQDGRFAFASELKALTQIQGFSRALNLDSIYHYFSLLYIPGKPSVFKQVERVAPGHSWTYCLQTNVLESKPYWRPDFRNTRDRSPAEWKTRIRHEFTQAVDRWTLSDVPVGCSLSGGVDSCAVTGVLAKAEKSGLKTYTLGFEGHEHPELDESVLAEQFAGSVGSEHKTLRIAPKAVIRDLLKMVWHLDEPYAGGLPSWYVYEFMSRDLKVAMTGSGGDELFSNYGYFSRLEVDPFLRKYMRIYPQLRKVFGHRLGTKGKWGCPIGANFEALRQYWSDEMKQSLLFAEEHRGIETQGFIQSLYDHCDGRNIRDGIASIGMTQQLPEEFLMVTDRFSMAHSLEARTPFLDKKFVEFALSIPSEIRIGSFDLKYLFKAALDDVLPEAVKRGRKYGFVLPLGQWLREDLREILRFFLTPERLRAQGLFKPDFWEHIVEPHLSGSSDMTYKIWPMFMFQLWHFLWVEQAAETVPSGDLFDLV